MFELLESLVGRNRAALASRWLLRTALGLLSVLAAHPAGATLLYYDSFNGTSGGSLDGTTPNFGGSSWANMENVNPGSLTATTITPPGGSIALPQAGGAVSIPQGPGNGTGWREQSILSAGNQGGSASTVWASFLMDFAPPNGTSFFSGVEFWNGNWNPAGPASNRSVYVGDIGSNLTITGGGNGVTGMVANNSFAGQPELVVMKFNYTGTNANNTVEVWMNPTLSQLTHNTGAAATLSGDTSQGFQFNQVNLANFNDSSGTRLIDEIRIGTTLRDVVAPEPGTWVLGSVAGLVGLVLARRNGHRRPAKAK